MKRVLLNNKGQRGFTLLEIIITIIAASIMGTMLVSLTGTALQKSGQPAASLANLYYLKQVMENISADYLNMLERNDVLEQLESRILDEDTDPLTGYGAYRTVERKRISFDGSNQEQDDVNSEILKVTIEPTGSSTGLRFTSLFINPNE